MTSSPRLDDELEITQPVRLTAPDGRLDPRAVGWSRRALHDTTLGGARGWGRTKRWEYWGVMTRTHVVGLTVANLDYAAQHQVWVLDRATLTAVDSVAVVPFGRGAVLPESLDGGPVRGTGRGLEIAIDVVDGRTRLRARTDRVSFDLVAAAPSQPDGRPGELMAVVVPWSERRFQYTVKDLARPTTGWLEVDGVRYDVGGGPGTAGEAWAVLDHGRGRWPYSLTWNWGAGSGRDGAGRRIGVQVGGTWTDGTGSTENALVVDGRTHKIGSTLVWEYDRTDWLAPWRVHDGDLGRVDLTFTPFYERASKTNALVIYAETHQCFGTWSGWMRDDAGERVVVDGVEGWAEEARNRW